MPLFSLAREQISFPWFEHDKEPGLFSEISFARSAPRPTPSSFVQVVEWKIPHKDVEIFQREKGTPGLDEVIRRTNQGDFSMRKSAHDLDWEKRPEPCIMHGTDYGHLCPEGWVFTEDGYQGPECQAPPNLEAPPPCSNLIGIKRSVPADLTLDQKKELEQACYVRWPCLGDKNDYSKLCPEGWTFLQDGTCEAPWLYHGTCNRHPNFLMYTKSMKAAWAQNCGVAWPLATPRDLALMKAHEENILSGQNCERDYEIDCPVGFTEKDGICQAPEMYLGKDIKNCASVDTSRFTPEMKKAFEEHCHVSWPCNPAPLPDEKPEPPEEPPNILATPAAPTLAEVEAPKVAPPGGALLASEYPYLAGTSPLLLGLAFL
eukprot:TRINITY_DN95129_c0_g1_i1.p1 TRINITY_DN95129_c0_g1~~TRINITY_DN95129_c0_g1_i1.p1  ORF type:complete len:374 (-),score=70.34 TRINITY_DN95129_c0_g1_i1:21-1142(-)